MTRRKRREGVFGGIVTVNALATVLILLDLFVGEPELSKKG